MIDGPTHSKRMDIIQARSERLKLWGSILGIVAAISASFFAYVKPEEDKGAKDVYKELSLAIQEVSKDQVQLHKDVSALQGYLEGRHIAEQEKRLVEGVAVVSNIHPSPVRIQVGVKKPPPEIKAQVETYNPPPVDAVVK